MFRCVEKIKKSHKRGKSCTIQKKLHGLKQSDDNTKKGYPLLYTDGDVTMDQVQEQQQVLNIINATNLNQYNN